MTCCDGGRRTRLNEVLRELRTEAHGLGNCRRLHAIDSAISWGGTAPESSVVSGKRTR
jgi:hypothetical protein